MRSIAIVAMLFSANLWAGRIVPEISWRGSVTNTTGAAAAIYGKDNLTLGLSSGDTKDNENSSYEGEYSRLRGKGRVASSELVSEFSVSEIKSTVNDTDTHTDTLFYTLGSEISSGLYLGGEFFHQKESSDEFNEFSVSVVKELERNYLMGLGLKRSSLSLSGIDKNTIFVGGGYLDKQDMALELYLYHSPLEDKDKDGLTYYTSETTGIRAAGLIHINNLEIASGLNFYNADADTSNDVVDREVEYRFYYLDLEYKMAPNFFLGSGVSKTIRESKNNNDTDDNLDRDLFSYFFKGRYTRDNLQAELGLAWASEEYDYKGFQDAEYEQDSIFLNLTYFL